MVNHSSLKPPPPTTCTLTHRDHLDVVPIAHKLPHGFNSSGQQAGKSQALQKKNLCPLWWLQHCGVDTGQGHTSASIRTTKLLSLSSKKRCAKHQSLTQLLRCLFFYASVFNFHFSSHHIPGIHNVAADAISRDNHSLLSSLLPRKTCIAVPPTVADFLLLNLDWSSPSWTELFICSLLWDTPLRHPGAVSPGSTATQPFATHTTSQGSH